jgi:hypothetical protein
MTKIKQRQEIEQLKREHMARANAEHAEKGNSRISSNNNESTEMQEVSFSSSISQVSQSSNLKKETIIVQNKTD